MGGRPITGFVHLLTRKTRNPRPPRRIPTAVRPWSAQSTSPLVGCRPRACGAAHFPVSLSHVTEGQVTSSDLESRVFSGTGDFCASLRQNMPPDDHVGPHGAVRRDYRQAERLSPRVPRSPTLKIPRVKRRRSRLWESLRRQFSHTSPFHGQLGTLSAAYFTLLPVWAVSAKLCCFPFLTRFSAICCVLQWEQGWRAPCGERSEDQRRSVRSSTRKLRIWRALGVRPSTLWGLSLWPLPFRRRLYSVSSQGEHTTVNDRAHHDSSHPPNRFCRGTAIIFGNPQVVMMDVFCAVIQGRHHQSGGYLLGLVCRGLSHNDYTAAFTTSSGATAHASASYV